MRVVSKIAPVVASAFLASACSNLIGDLPPDFALPMQEILLQTACELQDALWYLSNKEYSKFRAPYWLISVALNPKTDTDFQMGLGGTRKVPTRPNATTITTWALALPGLQSDYRTTRTGGVTFDFKSKDLIADKNLPCEMQTPSIHLLAQHLGVGEWLRRSAEAVSIVPSGTLDKNTYKTDITIKFTAAGSYTYLFPAGTDLANISGYYQVDQELVISMTALEENRPITAATLPPGQDFFGPGQRTTSVISTGSIELARTRLDLSQIEQAIRTLRTSP